MFKKQIILFPLALLLGIQVFSQEDEKTDKTDLGTEVVEIVKPFTPSVSDAFKIKENAVLNDTSVTQKRKVDYQISSVPVASTFTPAKGRAAKVEREKREKLYDNYARIGFGNYTNLLAEFYTNFEISNTDNIGFFFQHNSTQGGIKDLFLDDKFYNTKVDGHYTSRQNDATYKLDFGVDHQLINWYGLMDHADTYFPISDLIDMDAKQNYFSGYVGGSIALKNSYFEKVKANLRYMGDSFSSSEFRATLAPEFTFPMGDIDVTLDADVDYLTGSFDRGFDFSEGINYGFLNLGVAPALVFGNDDISVSLGVAGYLGMDSENSTSEFSLYPRVKASYRLDETILVYAGADGGLKQNSYYDFKEINPFVSPTLFIAPTKNTYDGYAGITGNISNLVAFNLKASYGNEANKPLFKANPIYSSASNEKPYQYGNSFQVVYDEINRLHVFGEVKAEISNMVTVGLHVNYFNYSTDVEAQAWNLPNIKASVFSEFDITKELYGGASIFFVGERKDYDFLQTNEVKLDPYVDANLHFGYRITDQFTAFVSGNNLFGDNYTKWMNYPVQGIQVMGGVTYKFDW